MPPMRPGTCILTGIVELDACPAVVMLWCMMHAGDTSDVRKNISEPGVVQASYITHKPCSTRRKHSSTTCSPALG